MAGSETYGGGTFTVNGGGVDIWGTSDQFRFVYQQLTGNGEIIARVTSLTNTDPWAKAGVMVREDLTANARQRDGTGIAGERLDLPAAGHSGRFDCQRFGYLRCRALLGPAGSRRLDV